MLKFELCTGEMFSTEWRLNESIMADSITEALESLVGLADQRFVVAYYDYFAIGTIEDGDVHYQIVHKHGEWETVDGVIYETCR